jgi:hypothetical protein
MCFIAVMFHDFNRLRPAKPERCCFIFSARWVWFMAARTNMARVGELDEVGEKVMNHTKPGVVGVYYKYRYDEEKKMHS